MFENKEFVGALTAIAESVSEEMFDSIIEGAAVLIDEAGMSMDEAVTTSAAALFNENLIDESAFAVTDAVMNEYASNRAIGWDEALNVIAESVDEETFDTLMTEAVNDMVEKVKTKGAEMKAAAAQKAGEAKEAAKTGAEYAKAAGQVAAKKVEKNVKAAAKDAKKTISDAKAAVKRQVLKNKVEDKIEDAKDAAAEKVDAAKEAVKAAGEKIADTAKAAKEKVAPKNESAMTLRDLRAIMESAMNTEEPAEQE